jgi:hypothetical protein
LASAGRGGSEAALDAERLRAGGRGGPLRLRLALPLLPWPLDAAARAAAWARGLGGGVGGGLSGGLGGGCAARARWLPGAGRGPLLPRRLWAFSARATMAKASAIIASTSTDWLLPSGDFDEAEEALPPRLLELLLLLLLLLRALPWRRSWLWCDDARLGSGSG